MAKLPDGWIFIPKMKNAVTVELEQRKLVMCRNCKHSALDESGVDKVYWCSAHTEYHDGDWFCADGEHKEVK